MQKVHEGVLWLPTFTDVDWQVIMIMRILTFQAKLQLQNTGPLISVLIAPICYLLCFSSLQCAYVTVNTGGSAVG